MSDEKRVSTNLFCLIYIKAELPAIWICGLGGKATGELISHSVINQNSCVNYLAPSQEPILIDQPIGN